MIAPSASERASAQISQPETAQDPNMEILMQIKGKMKTEEVNFTKSMIQASDKKTLTFFKCYKMTKDEGDLINSLQRYCAKSKK